MDIVILEILLVWLTIGVVIGGWISIDTFRRKVEGARWVAAGIFLNVIGLALYLYMRKRANIARSLEPHPAPEYRYPDPSTFNAPPSPVVKSAGEQGPAITAEPGPVQAEAGGEQQVPQPPATVMEERSQYHSWAPVIREQIEGAPRCPKCGFAASGFDEFCSECGAKIK
jgi:hypothetical protein